MQYLSRRMVTESLPCPNALASCAKRLYSIYMDNRAPQQNSLAGGIFIVVGLVLGIIAGIIFGEISLGLIIGFAIGVAAAIAVWLIDRQRQLKE